MSWVGFDIETAGTAGDPAMALQPWRVGTGEACITSWVESHGSRCDVSAVSGWCRDDIAHKLREMLQRWVDEKTTVCVWNGAFETSWMTAYGLDDLTPLVRWVDGMLLWRHLEMTPEYEISYVKKQSFGLKVAVARFMPQHAGYGEHIDFQKPTFQLLAYNAKDAWFTRALTRYFYTQLEQRPRALRAALIESHAIPFVGKANHDGLLVATDKIDALHENLTAVREKALEALSWYGVTETVLNSPKKLANLLFDEWGLEPIKFTKTGPSTDKETLRELAISDPHVQHIADFREATGNRKKFCQNIKDSVEYNGDGRTRPQARIFGTYSGRLTYTSKQMDRSSTPQRQLPIGFALHQMKRAADFRRLIRAPKGHVVVEFDAAGQEFRWMAIKSGDETMLKLCLPGEDPHAFMGSQVSNGDYREIQEGAKAGDAALHHIRHMGKVGNLSLQYRTSAKKLLSTARTQHKMDIDMAVASRIWRTYRQTYAGVPRYWGRQINFVKTYGYAETIAGRRVQVPRSLLVDYEWSVESTSINYPIQGTGADQKYLALSVLRPLLTQMDATFMFDLHDGLYFAVPVNHADRFISLGRDALNRLPYKKAWNFEPPIPLPWDAKAGNNWGDMVEV